MTAGILASSSPSSVAPFFKFLSYTGTGSAHGITGVGFQPDAVIIKDTGNTRTLSANSTHGTGKYINMTNAGGSTTDANSLTSFDSDGFSIGTSAAWDTNTNTYRSLSLKKVTTAFDIVSYTGNGSNRTLSHNLGATPVMIITIPTAAGTDVTMYHSQMNASPATVGLFWANSTVTTTTSATYWNNTAPTSTQFTLGTGVTNDTSVTFNAYLFGSVSGKMAVGTYTGNGNATGPSVTPSGFTGITPTLVIIFKQSASGNNVWFTTGNSQNFKINNLGTQDTTNFIDLVSGGFNVKTTNADFNTNLATYCYTVFA